MDRADETIDKRPKFMTGRKETFETDHGISFFANAVKELTVLTSGCILHNGNELLYRDGISKLINKSKNK